LIHARQEEQLDGAQEREAVDLHLLIAKRLGLLRVEVTGSTGSSNSALWIMAVRQDETIPACSLYLLAMAMYQLYIGSMFATMDMKLGLLSTPGAAWMASAPMITAGFCEPERVRKQWASGMG